MRDINRAKDHLLKGEENIPGSEFAELNDSSFVRGLVAKMRQINPQLLAFNIKLMSWSAQYLLSTISLSVLFSQFTTDNDSLSICRDQLYIRYVNLLPKDRSLLQLFDPKFVTLILQAVKHSCEIIESDDMQDFMNQILEMATTQPFFHEVLVVLKDPALHIILQSYKRLLDDDVFEALQSIASSIHQFLMNTPKYSHIIGTYLSSMIFSTDRLIKIMAVYRDLAYVVQKQKNTLDAFNIYASIFVLSLFMLPLNIFSSIINVNICAKIFLFASGYVILSSSIQMICALYSWVYDVQNNGFTQNNFGQLIQEFLVLCWNISARYPLEIVIGIIDNLIYWLGWPPVLHKQMNEALHYLDTIHKSWFISSINPDNVNDDEETSLTIVNPCQHHNPQYT